MEISDQTTIFFALGFVLPGHVWATTQRFFVPGVEQPEGYRFLFNGLHLSILNYAICLPIVYLLLYSPIFVGHPFRSTIAWGFVISVLPMFWGAIHGLSIQRGWGKKLRDLFLIRSVHPTQLAWDYRFGLLTPNFIIVTLQDGSTVAGLFGTQSFASSHPENRDLFLEKTYQIDDGGVWVPVEDSAGLWLRGEDIKIVEFREARPKEKT